MYAYLLEFVAFVIERKLSLASAIFPMKFERFQHWIRNIWELGQLQGRVEDGRVHDWQSKGRRCGQITCLSHVSVT